ncbi:unnamed protein product [Rotaria magnacalcarata]|uniref:Reverse transcriptase domain-containing protein n=1 Tax=Rotaria magnacalcarata TaxID=392030 RepID=A0A817A631_9BILA|nr:unnamed protein product [Rotaria magnacalcarata]CAF2232134.1 unnamed protein product [Rotaria magnacalcarata]
MDYINFYNLSIDVKHQTLSIKYHNRILTTTIDPDYKLRKIPVTSSQSTYIPPYSTRSAHVTIPISSMRSSLIPNQYLYRDSTLFVTHTLLNFRNYCSTISFSNTFSLPRLIRKGSCVGFLLYRTQSHSLPILPTYLHESYDATGNSGESTVPCDSHTDYVPPVPQPRSFLLSIMNPTDSMYSHNVPHCNTIQLSHLPLHCHIDTLVKTIENRSHRDALYSFLSRDHQTFDVSKHNISKTSINHVITTVPHSPPANKSYPQPDKEQIMCKLMQEFLKVDLISESHSPYAAPALLVKKKDGSYRFVVDYKRLNLITIKDSSPLPNMEDAIRKLDQGYNYFSKLDLKSGFYQIPIKNADKEKTAFVTPFELYQFNVLPMGLKNSPPTFQKVMTDTLKSCRLFSLVYLDDIIIFSKSFDEHLHHIECVLSAMQTKNSVLNPPKCVFATNQIDYLGHTISQRHIIPMKEKIEAILQIAEPRSLAHANKFIGARG